MTSCQSCLTPPMRCDLLPLMGQGVGRRERSRAPSLRLHPPLQAASHRNQTPHRSRRCAGGVCGCACMCVCVRAHICCFLPQRGVPPPPVPGGKGGIKVPSLHRGNSGKGSPSQKRPVPTVVVSVASRTPTPTKQDVPPIPTPPLSLPPILPVPASVLPSLPSHVPATPMIRLTTSSFFGSIALFAMAINRQARASRTAAQQAQHQSSAVREVLSQAAAFLVWKYEEGSTAPGSVCVCVCVAMRCSHARPDDAYPFTLVVADCFSIGSTHR